MRNFLRNPIVLIVIAMVMGAITYNSMDVWVGFKYIAYVCFAYLLLVFGRALFYAFKK